MEPKITKKQCEYCHGRGFNMGREPEEGGQFRVNCAWCNSFGILLRRGKGKWEKLKPFLETLRVGPG